MIRNISDSLSDTEKAYNQTLELKQDLLVLFPRFCPEHSLFGFHLLPIHTGRIGPYNYLQIRYDMTEIQIYHAFSRLFAAWHPGRLVPRLLFSHKAVQIASVVTE